MSEFATAVRLHRHIASTSDSIPLEAYLRSCDTYTGVQAELMNYVADVTCASEQVSARLLFAAHVGRAFFADYGMDAFASYDDNDETVYLTLVAVQADEMSVHLCERLVTALRRLQRYCPHYAGCRFEQVTQFGLCRVAFYKE